MTSQCKLLKIVSHVEEEIDDTKGVNRTRTDNTMEKRKKDKKPSTKHYTEN